MSVASPPVQAPVVVFTRDSPPRDGFFSGYCFEGTDYIFGAQGAHDFEKSTGRALGPGLDGCYVTAHREGANHRISNDHAGHATLYYYRDDDWWGVSNSYARLVDEMRRANVAVKPHYPELASAAAFGPVYEQLFSFNTPVVGVRLVPRAHCLVIGDDVLFLRRWKQSQPGSYEELLSGHLDLWVGRMETLMLAEGVGVTADVTGGVDSRTNFGLIGAAKARLGGQGEQVRLNCGSTPRKQADLRVAMALGEAFGLEINDGRIFPRQNLTPEGAYETFRALQAGVSHTLYLPVEAPVVSKVSISGGGGEIHRKRYELSHGINTFDDLIKPFVQHSRYPWARYELLRDGREALKHIQHFHDDPLWLHFREFRARYHGGRHSRYGVNFTPLVSASADAAQYAAGTRRVIEGQFIYDVLRSLDRRLVDMPFDDPGKSPSGDTRRNMTIAPLPHSPRPGRVWGAQGQEILPVRRDSSARNAMLQEQLEASLRDPFVRDFLGDEYCAQAECAMRTLVESGRLDNARDGRPIAAAWSAAIAAPA